MFKRFTWICILVVPMLSAPEGYLFAQKKQALYKDPKASIASRVQDLLSRMTAAEKTGQLLTLPGWEMYVRNGKQTSVSDKFKKAVAEQHVGSLWATLRADPWTKKTLDNGLNPYTAAQTCNMLQKYVLQHSRLQIPVFIAEECPHGHMAIGTTVFPTSIAQASTWNPMLIEKMAAVIAKEARLQGAHIGYGPILDLAREPRWSRVEETYGEDPVLIAAMGVAMVKGFQGSDLNNGRQVISTLKHFAAYGVPEGGQNGGLVNTGMRELYQSYLPPFKSAIAAGALSVMTAYNSIDGIPCTANSFLLEDVLRKQWNFKGFTISDLGSIDGLMHNHVAENLGTAAALAINSGVDSDLGGAAYAEPLQKALMDGRVSATRLDEAVGRILTLKFEMGLFENPYVDPQKAKEYVRNTESVSLARQLAQESVILLKNEDQTLPIKKYIRSIAVIGPNADNVYNQLGDYTAPQDPANVVTVLEGIQAKVSPDVSVRYVKGCDIRDTTDVHIEEAVRAARVSDIAVLVLGGSSARDFKTEYLQTGAATVKAQKERISDMESGEGYDRSSLDMMGKQLELLQAVVKTGRPLVLVVIGGRPLNLNWAALHVPAILYAWYPGQEGGHALADVLFGDYNPAGRLPISIPRSVGQLPVYYNYKAPQKHNYVEESASPLYPFGYGMSYSKFEYSNMKVSLKETEGLSLDVEFDLSNTSNLDGDEVIQLYVQDQVASVVLPLQQLKAFKRIRLKAKEKKQVRFQLTAADLLLYDPALKPVVEAGKFTIMLGSASSDIRLKQEVNILGNRQL